MVRGRLRYDFKFPLLTCTELLEEEKLFFRNSNETKVFRVCVHRGWFTEGDEMIHISDNCILQLEVQRTSATQQGPSLQGKSEKQSWTLTIEAALQTALSKLWPQLQQVSPWKCTHKIFRISDSMCHMPLLMPMT